MQTVPWHALPIPDVARRLASSPDGVSWSHAEQQLALKGLNLVEHRRGLAGWRLFGAQLKSPLIIILLIAAGIAYAIGEHTDGIVIASIVVFNALVGYWQERQAGRAMERLRSLTPQEVAVIRDGREHRIASERLVPGDVIILETGVVLPADGRLIEAVNLKVNEAVFTGESVPAEKSAAAFPEGTALADQHDMAWRGTTVVYGRGRLLVTETGMATRIGEIVRAVGAAKREATPFQKKLNAFSRRLTGIVFFFALIVFVTGLARALPMETVFLLAVSLVVSLIPEGLPVVITLTLATGMWQMAKRQALIRKLTAVESLGSVTTIAADKTGTLTFGEMMVEHVAVADHVVNVTGEGYSIRGDFFIGQQPLDPSTIPELVVALKVAALCNDARFAETMDGKPSPVGDPTEIALLVLAEKAGFQHRKLLEAMPRVGEFPFDFNVRYMVTFHSVDGGRRQFVAVKGAPRQILDLCDKVSLHGQHHPFRPEAKDRVREQFEHMAQDGLRGLALAYAETTDDWRSLASHHLKGKLTYLGLCALRDTIRSEARETLAIAEQAGIRVLMLTGDYRVTAVAVARDIGLLETPHPLAVLDGKELAALSPAALRERLPHLRVASRVSPEQKLRIARAFVDQGKVIAMTGDGINDVPALSVATVGIAIGANATDAAKDAADMIVTDGRLSSIVAAIREGRTIYRNIQRTLLFLLASNFAELIVIVVALFAGLPLPLLPTQIIWLNAITDPFMGIALAQEPGKATVLQEPPRPVQQPIVNRGQWLRIGWVALAIAFGTFLVFLRELRLGVSPEHLYAMTLTTMALGEWFSAFAFRSSRRSFFSLFSTNRFLWPALALVLALQVGILYVPTLATVFHVAPLTAVDWLIAFLGGLPVLILEECRKALLRRRKTV